jgi:hypothetical protein
VRQQKHPCLILQVSSESKMPDALNYPSILAESWEDIKEKDLPPAVPLLEDGPITAGSRYRD